MFDNKIGECYIHRIRSINLILILKGDLHIWDTQKNIEEDEKWVQRRDELVKEIRENKSI